MLMLQISEKIRDHLTTQKRKSVFMGNEKCAYRGHNGTMCAVGCLITDEVYNKSVNGFGDNFLENRMGCDTAVFGAVNESLGVEAFDQFTARDVLVKWQQYHDSFYSENLNGQPFSYRCWLETKDALHSPQAMHDHVMRGGM